MSDIKLSKDMIGSKVRCVNKIDIHHPEQGIIGTIVAYDEHDAICNYKVQWPKGSTVGNDRWWAINKCIELVKDDVTTSQKTADMTNEEIWKMLEPKMVKNGLKSTTSTVRLPAQWCYGDPVDIVKSYEENMVHNAIALAYKVGYLRSQKGRPFKIGEKKKKGGHWEPVDPNNLPKKGTRVRYTRECRGYKNCSNKITLGSTGIVRFEGPEHNWFGMSFDDYEGMYYNWLSFDGLTAKSLDMWVEDDE